MSDDLVKRLRKGDPFGGVMQRAADRIEALEAENADLSEACAKWAEVSQGNYRRAKDAEAERDALEAALAKADELERAILEDFREENMETIRALSIARRAYRQARDATR